MQQPPKITFTKEGFAALVKEEQDLTTKRPHVLKRMVEAREQGDLSENAGYHAAKEGLGYIDSRLRAIKDLKRFGQIIEGSQNGEVNVSSTVTVDNQGEKQTFTIVGELEANPMENKLSKTSPIGSALIGKKVNDSVVVEIPAGKLFLKILEVK